MKRKHFYNDIFDWYSKNKSKEIDLLDFIIEFDKSIISFNQKYSIYMPDIIAINMGNNRPTDTSELYSYPVTDRGFNWLLIFNQIFPKEANFLLDIFVNAGYLGWEKW